MQLLQLQPNYHQTLFCGLIPLEFCFIIINEGLRFTSYINGSIILANEMYILAIGLLDLCGLIFYHLLSSVVIPCQF